MEPTDGDPAVSREPGETGCIAVRNDYEWIGAPKAGRFAVYLDGRFAGWAPLGGEFRQVLPGPHFLRVRWNYFLSPRVLLTIEQDETKRYSADMPRTHRFRAFLRAMIDPFHMICLTEIDPQGEDDSLVTAQQAVSRQAKAARAARIALITGLASDVLIVFIIWPFDFTVHPHRAAVAVIFLVAVGPAQWFIYRTLRSRAR